MVKELNRIYQSYPALYEKQFSPEGFHWIDYGDAENSVLAYIRKGHNTKNDLIVVCNFTPVPREGYRIGVPKTKALKEIFNSDSGEYGGSGISNKSLKTTKTESHGYKQSISLTIPPLGVLILQ
jgi:1,4-alpha-glucan branching enzyme